MAITRARLPLSLPWRRGSDLPPIVASAPMAEPDPTPVNASPAVEPPPVPATASPMPQPLIEPLAPPSPPAAPGASDRPRPVRGPDGRFVRRSAPTGADPRPAQALPTPALAPTSVWGRVEVPAPAAAAAPEPAPPTTDAQHARHESSAPVGATPAGAFERRPFETAIEPGDQGPVADRSTQPLRIVLVEDVPEVVDHVRELLGPQGRFKLVHVIMDGGRAADDIRSLEPDVVIVDSLLQGRTSGATLAARLRSAGSTVGIVALTVPDHPLESAMEEHADAVVTLPIRTFELSRGILEAHAASTARDPSASSRIVAVFSPKGGVGTTTIAFNLAVSLAATGLRTLLVDGCLQFGDVRRLLGADPTAPSICDLPTHSVRGADLTDVVVRHSSLDVLLAPPRPELADLVTGRDLDQLIDVLRRTYQAIVIDTPSSLSESTLAFLDAADMILDVLTPDPATVDITRVISDTFAEIGYPTDKIRYLVNQHDAPGGVPASALARVLGREPDHTVAADRTLVSASNAQGIPFVLAQANAPASVDLRRVAQGVRSVAGAPVAPAGARRAWRH